MRKTVSKKYGILLISALAVSAGIALACAGDWGPEFGTSNFAPEVFVDSVYSPFFYSTNFYYGINHDEGHDSRFNASNTREWSAFLSGKVSPADLEWFLQRATGQQIDSALLSATHDKTSNHKPGDDKKLVSFLKYLQLAKKAEVFALNNGEYSYYEKKPARASFDATVLNKQLKDGFTNASGLFLKERYWFQWLRSCYFNTSPTETISVFETNEKKFPHDKTWYRCLAYTAGAWYKQKNYAKANYEYSLVYDGCDELKTVAHYSFHPQEEKDWNATLALCTSNDQQATLWQMLGIFYSDEKRAIREIYRLNPKSEKLDLLLARAVNIAEQDFHEWDPARPVSTFGKKTESDTLGILVGTIADAGSTDKPWIWQLAAGYLKTLDQQFGAASERYAKAEKLLPAGTLPHEQLRLLKLVNRVAALKKIDGKQEQELLADIKWLSDPKTSQGDGFRSSDAFDWLKKVLASRYKSQGELVKSECFFTSPEFYQDEKNVEALKAFFNKPAKTPYENLCDSLSVTHKDDLFDFQAIRRSLKDQTDEAIALIGQSQTGAATVLPGNPFNGRVQDCHDCDHAATQKIKYTRLSLLQKMKELKDKVAAGQDIFTNALLLGNAHYNMTYYGNARAFYECKLICPEGSSPFISESPFTTELADMSYAIKYYTLALGAAQNDEQKAKCQFLLAKCQRNEWYNRNDEAKKSPGNRLEDVGDSKNPDFIAWEGFKALRSYPHTEYYKEVLKECGYFKTYTGKHPQTTH